MKAIELTSPILLLGASGVVVVAIFVSAVASSWNRIDESGGLWGGRFGRWLDRHLSDPTDRGGWQSHDVD